MEKAKKEENERNGQKTRRGSRIGGIDVMKGREKER